MKYFLLLISLFILTHCNGQDARRIKWTTQMQRCLDSSGNPIENCVTLSGVDGKYRQYPVDDLNLILQQINESAVDSIYTFNDTLYIVYFDAPTLKYKANGLNGLYSASNNNKTFAVTSATLPTSGMTWIPATIGGNIKFGGLASLNPTATTGNGYGMYILPNGSNKAVIASAGSSQVWQFGSVGNIWKILDQTHSATTIVGINPSGVNTSPVSNISLNIQGDGDIDLGSYKQGTRTPVNNWLNITHTGTNGQLEIASKQAVIDTVTAHVVTSASYVNDYSTSEQVYHGEKWFGQTIYWITFLLSSPSGAYLDTGIPVASITPIKAFAFSEWDGNDDGAFGQGVMMFGSGSTIVQRSGTWQCETPTGGGGGTDQVNIKLTIWYTKP